MEETSKKIKEAILSTAEKYGIGIDRIILFGSRARGDYRGKSDWDILVVTKERLSYTARKSFLSEVRWELVNFGIIPEILVVDSETFESNKRFAGFVYYWAKKEGIML